MPVLRAVSKEPVEYGPGSVQVGPLQVQTACPLQYPFSRLGLTGFAAPCAVTVKNTGRVALMVVSMQETGTAPTLDTSPPGPYSIQASGVLGRLAPGQTVTLPAPSQGYTGWAFVSVNVEAMHRNILVLDAIAAVLGAGTFAVGYYIGRRRHR